MQNTLNCIIKCSIYVLVFLIPIFFLPFSFEAFEFNKLYLLLFLTSLGFFAWLAKMVIYDKELRLRRTPLDVFILIFLAVAVLSAIFSVDKISSVFGFYGRFSGGLAGLLSMVMFYFLVTNNAGKEDSDRALKAGKLVKLFLWGVGIAVAATYFTLFGLWSKLAGIVSLPSLFTSTTFNMVTGSFEGLAVFLAIALVLLAGLMAGSERESKWSGFGKWLLLAASVVLLIIIDFSSSWTILIISLSLFVVFSLWKRIFRENVNKLLVPIILIIAAACLMVFNPGRTIFGEDSTLVNLPQEQLLSQNVSWSVGLSTATSDIKSGFLGSGPATFSYDFAKYKPVEINESWLWQIRFDRAGNHFAEILATMGFLGLLSYLSIIGLFMVMGYLLVAKINNVSEAYPFQISLLLTSLALLVAQFVYYQNTTLAFAFWLVLGLSMVAWQKPIKEKVISFKDFPELSLILSTIVIILGVAILSLYFFAVKFYLADVNYNNALSLLGEERTQYLEKAVKLNPNLPRYRIALSRTYLYEALQEMAKPQEEQNSAKIQTRVAKAINEAREATRLQENQVTGWENLGVVYREIIGVAQGSVDWGIKSFKEAIKYEPTNPVLYTELGKLYLAQGDIAKAKEQFNKATDVMPGYAEARIQLALLSERENALPEAIAEMEDFVNENPYNVEGLFQLGRLYFNNNQVEKAIQQFSMVTALIPNHSNAHYSLGVAYASQGEKEQAIRHFERVLELNPGNQDVIQKLNDLKTVPQESEEEEEGE